MASTSKNANGRVGLVLASLLLFFSSDNRQMHRLIP